MSFRVVIRNTGEAITVEMGQTVLEAALGQGVPYPHGCRSGNCGACKSELASGEVEMSPYSEYALSDAEKGAGLVLACRSVPWSDAELRWLDANETVAHPLRRMNCRVVGLEQATHDIRVVRLAVESGGPFDFSAGQYASISFAGLPPRDFSMANRPDESPLEFHIRLTPGGRVSPFVATQLKEGDAVTVEGPYGSSHWRENHAGPILAVAGGSGLAPIKSIVETGLMAGARQPIHLYFGARAERDVYLEERFEELAARHPNFRFTIVLSEPGGPTARPTGFLADAIARDFTDLDGAKAYLAGPPIMVETVEQVLKRLGMRRQDCHADAFYTEAEKAQIDSGARS
jgi:CDP-4-dehydro-6-deoxyglucose reductase/ferredoxin-NAD(P)+ reductase (naphthalene dioxygenase ferredoxin-specific)